ncbi:hypothetical protein GJW-30_1_03106 [Variibacter gotjawalensis]|uniref:DUF177 domain-containing protein n=1 Tax=Variibacter gotjawalensis TaxID=1333996 RepID=A0A0S3PXS4_9BRAD|nr:DUF177 domain-containing protein [Variibacter gotjawalensis]RZS48300.1 uncharacterized metal-binding protein YceD (DUF177 family) [Variibacter gotjawalensis]BAT60560.1 hypothetical protein GJW-30_1_03106 [Variibacter gotjawalensis]
MVDLNAAAWSSPIRAEDVPEKGRHVNLVADETARDAVAKLAKVDAVSDLKASFDVSPRGAGLHVGGRVTATVRQKCVVSLEPIENRIDEEIAVSFSPHITDAPQHREDDEEVETNMITDGPEPLIDGTVDLGGLAVEFLLLGIDPYPRKEGVAFEPPKDAKDDPGPFAALAALKKKQ